MYNLDQDKIEKYAVFYMGRENFYHNLNHAIFVAKMGLRIIEEDYPGIPSFWKDIYQGAALCHDAGHGCGGVTDDKNIEVARQIFLSINSAEVVQRGGVLLIEATRFPTQKTIEEILDEEKLLAGILAERVTLLMKVIRDADQLGIIGIDDPFERFKALTGLMRENLKTCTPEQLVAGALDKTVKFFSDLSWNTVYGSAWAKEHLEERKRWQLEKVIDAIKCAATVEV